MSPLLPFSLRRWLAAGVTGLAMTLPASAEDLIINNFDTADEVPQWPNENFPSKPNNVWELWWGQAITDGVSLSFDASMDAAGSAASGSMKLVADFDRINGKGEYSVVRYLADTPLDGSQYLSLEMDVRFKPDAVTRPDGTFGTLEVGFATMTYGQIYTARVPIPVSAGSEWYHISTPISKVADQIDQLRGIHFKMWMGGETDPVGNSTMWVDNIRLIPPAVVEEPPVPEIRVEPAVPGLHLVSSAPGIYDRQTLRTVAPEYSWVGRNQPVTYSFTIKEFPSTPGYNAFLYLTPGSGFATGLNYVDYSAENCVVLFLTNNADGSGGMRLAFKDSAPNSNGQAGHDYWTTDDGTGKGGTLAYVNSSTITGTWSLTFESDTAATITSPDGQTATGSLLPETAAKYANPVYAYFGTMPGDAARQGRTAVYSRIKISGTANPIDENFSVMPFTELLEKSASDANGVQQVTPLDTPFWVKWSLPAVGYKLQQSLDLGATGWQEIPMTGALTVLSERWRLMNATELPDPTLKKGFFQLIKP
ncbi:MAG: hypothetical protein EOP86_08160 [Verrucomicrobiaceae bacterium]|nr:MAG: hypothetical protein EOP86_08160 [Verrucomicrobiaceae bacterium]